MKDKKAKPAKKHTAMKLPQTAQASRNPMANAGSQSWQHGGGKPHKSPEHLMGKARKVH
ncbi:MAG TPA: hypothetical protein VHE37_00015 [Nevskiaceae bacterium]|nr:hypothetical protein [Nevskiaceae bacterium]